LSQEAGERFVWMFGGVFIKIRIKFFVIDMEAEIHESIGYHDH
jgi:hypothetical protein